MDVSGASLSACPYDRIEEFMHWYESASSYLRAALRMDELHGERA